MVPFFGGCEDKADGQLSQKEKLEDFNYMYEVIKEGHPFLEVNKRVHGIDWLANKEKYEERIRNTTNDKEFINEMQYSLSKLNNGHSHVVTDNTFFKLVKELDKKFKWYDFWDNPKVIKRYEEATETVNETDNYTKGSSVFVNDVVDDKIGYLRLSEMVVLDEDIERDLAIVEEYLKGLDNYEALVIDIRGNRGGNDLFWESIVSMIIPEDMRRTGYTLFRSGEIVDKYVDSTGIKVRDINELIALDLENMPEEVATDFNSFCENDRIIESKKVSNFNGKIYLLIDRAVFSSSESFAIFAKDTGFATLIGEVTKGDGGGVAPVLFDLPNSGLIIRIPVDMYLTSNGECNEEFKTTPDYRIIDPIIGNIKTDFSQDKCIRKVLELEELRKNQ